MCRFFTFSFFLLAITIALGSGVPPVYGQTGVGTGGPLDLSAPSSPPASFGNLGNLPATPSFGGSTSGGTAVGNAADTPNMELSGNVGNATLSNANANTYDTAVSPQAQAVAQTVNAQIVPQAGCVSGKEGTTLVDNIYGCIGYVVHYILFSPTAWFMGVMGVFLNLVVQELIVSFGSQTTIIATVTEGWQIFRDLANMLIIFFLLLTGIATILRMEQWGWRKFLSRVIIAALVINFSLFITKVVIDTSNLFTAQIYSAILTKAYGGQNGASSANGQVSCLEDRATRLATLAGNRGNSATNVSSNNSLSEGLLEDPCVSAGLSGAFTSVLRMTTLMTVPAGWQGATGAGGNVEFAVTSESFLIINLLGAFMFLTLALIFGAMAIMLLIRWVVLIMLMLFSPIWMVGLVFGHGGKKYWDRLIENAIFPPLFFIMVYASYIIANGMKVAVNSNSTATGDVASYTLIAAGQGGWYLLLHFVLVILMLIYAMKWALEAGDETARAGGIAALGVGASAGYGLWKGTKWLGGGAYTQGVSRGARAIGRVMDKSGISNTFGMRNVRLGLEKASQRIADRESKLAEKRNKVATLVTSNKENPTGAEVAQLTPETFKQRMASLGRTKAIGWLNGVANQLSPHQIEGIVKSSNLTLAEANTLRDQHFRGAIGADGKLKPRLYDLLESVAAAEDTKKKADASGTAEEKAKANADLARAREAAKTEVAKLNNAQISMLGERGIRNIMQDTAHPEAFATLASSLTRNQVEHISKDSAFSEDLENKIKGARYQVLESTFDDFAREAASKPGTHPDVLRTKQAFNKAYRGFSADELGHATLFSRFAEGITDKDGNVVVGGTEAIQAFTDSLSARELGEIQRSKEWEDSWKGKIIDARYRDFNKWVDLIGKGETVYEERDGKRVAVDLQEKLRDTMKNFTETDYKYGAVSDTITQGNEAQQRAIAFATKGSQFDAMRKAEIDTNGTVIDRLKTYKTEEAQRLATEDPEAFRAFINKPTAPQLLLENQDIFQVPETIQHLQTAQIKKIAAEGSEKTRQEILKYYRNLTESTRQLTGEQVAVMEELVGEFTKGLYSTPADLEMKMKQRIAEYKKTDTGAKSTTYTQDTAETMPGFGREDNA